MKVLLALSVLVISAMAEKPGVMDTVKEIYYPNKLEYHYGRAGKEEHRFGYEVNHEAKPFHHSSSAPDGVRVGCYGHILEGKKYVTLYVADDHGYRVITHTPMPITVYPKDGGERLASFAGEFGEKEISYFIPEGCKGSARVAVPVVPITTTTTTTKAPTTTPITTRSTTTPTTTRSTTPKVITTTPKVITTPRTTTVDGSSKTNFGISWNVPPPSTNYGRKVPIGECDVNACGTNVPKLVLPVPMKSKTGEESCEFGKLTIPVKGLELESLRKLVVDGDSKDLVKSILKNLQ